MDKSWDFLLSEFRKLGGIAENVCQKEGGLGRGIFSENPNLRSRIFTPSNLMIKKDDICLEGNNLRIKNDTNYCKKTREFFNYYQDHFSWGGGGKETTESFEEGISLFPSYLKKLIKKNLLVDIEERHKGNWNNILKKQFLNSRAVEFGQDSVIAPMWDLFNHEVNAFPFIKRFNGISTPNYAPRESELTYVYGYLSSISRVFNYGCFCKESIVFSLPFNIMLNDLKTEIICKGLELKNDNINYQLNGFQIIIDGLPIAAINKKSFVQNYFEKFLDLTDLRNLNQDLFSKIVNLNYSRRKEILDELSLINNFSSRMISSSINYEIDLISHL